MKIVLAAIVLVLAMPIVVDLTWHAKVDNARFLEQFRRRLGRQLSLRLDPPLSPLPILLPQSLLSPRIYPRQSHRRRHRFLHSGVVVVVDAPLTAALP